MTATVLDIALYSTVWIAIALFVAGEVGKARARRSSSAGRWALIISSAGAVLLSMHIALALQLRHSWNHASVVRTVAEQSRSVYGVGWPGAVWMNYGFLGLWLADVLWWRLASRAYFTRPGYLTAVIRVFYGLILANAAIVFAAPSRRLPGLAMMAVLLWVWRDTFSAGGRLDRERPVAASSNV